MGVRPEMVKVASQMALIPIWFLAVYVIVVVLVPITFAAWERLGFKSFGLLVLAAVIDDLLFFAADLQALGWLNYGFVWLDGDVFEHYNRKCAHHGDDLSRS